MQLPEKAIKEFQEIYKKEYGKEISWQDASDSSHRLINLFKVIYRPIKKDNSSKYY